MTSGAVVWGMARGAPLRPILSQRRGSVESEPAGGVGHIRTVTAPARLGRVAVEADLRLCGGGRPVGLVPALRVRHREAMALLAIQFGVVAAAAHGGTLLIHQLSVRAKEGDRMRHADAVTISTNQAVRRSHGSRVTGARMARQTGDALAKVQRMRERLAVLKRKQRAEVGMASQTGAVRDGEIRLERKSHRFCGQHSGGGLVARCVHGPAARSSHQSHDPQSAHECEAPERPGNQKNTGHRTSNRV